MNLEIHRFNELPPDARKVYDQFANGQYHFSPDILSCAEIIEHGPIHIAHFKSEFGTLFHVFVQREIGQDFKGGKYFDLVSPYDFVTYLTDSTTAPPEYSLLVNAFRKEFSEWCVRNSIVCEFLRFNPMRHGRVAGISGDIFVQNNHVVNLRAGYSAVQSAYSAKNRQKLRTAARRGAHAQVADNPIGLEDDFFRLYEMTMERHNAENQLRFPLEYFKKLFATGRVAVSAARAPGAQCAAMGIFQLDGDFSYYFLSGSDRAFRDLHPNNIMLDAQIKWAAGKGMSALHLGGGSYASLNEFKKGFANSEAPYYIRKDIFLPSVYDELAANWRELNPGIESKNFPIYRTLADSGAT
jgi:serine/alanine adding enzyme